MIKRRTVLLFVCFCLFSAAAMHAQQASFVEEVTGASDAGINCQDISSKNFKIYCTGSWVSDSAEGYEIAVAKNGFGSMGAYSFSSVTGSGADFAYINDGIEDYLSIFGLNSEPTAFLKLEFECLSCTTVPYPAAYYDGYAGMGYGPCQIYGGTSPTCTLTVPISYDSAGQPFPVAIQRELQVTAATNVSGPPNAPVTTAVCVGNVPGYCLTLGATLKVSVVTAKGKVFKGVTVVGASGHLYN